MTRSPSKPRRKLLVTAALGAMMVALLLGSASAALVPPDVVPADRGEHPLRRAVAHMAGRAMGFPDTEVAVRLQCAPRSPDGNPPAVACAWSADTDADIRSWQLWKLRVRPESDGRVLVTEVGAATTSHLDTVAVTPGVHLYAVLAFDGAGEIVGRSRVRSVTVPVPEREVEVLELECDAHRLEGDRGPAVVVGCDWRASSDRTTAGYVVWKRTDGGERSVLARVGPATTALRDGEVSFGHRYSYVVTAVDADGAVVGRSRTATVGIPQLERPVDPPAERPADAPAPRPVDEPAPRSVEAPAEPPVAAPAVRPVEAADQAEVVTPAARPAPAGRGVRPGAS